MPGLQSRPTVSPHLLLYWRGYNRLTNGRQGEWEPQRITVTDVRSYCDLIGLIDLHQRDNMLDVVQLLDRENFQLLGEQRKLKADAEEARKAQAHAPRRPHIASENN
jgi:hypothetical protein